MNRDFQTGLVCGIRWSLLSGAFAYAELRFKILNFVMRTVLLAFLVALPFWMLQNTSPIQKGFYVVVFVILTILTFTALPYTAKAASFVSLFFAVAVVRLASNGHPGQYRGFFPFLFPADFAALR